TVNLKWRVTNEVNDDHFEVEFSSDGQSFQQIGGNVRAINGSANSYEYSHMSPFLDKMNYYRIKQIDKDGKYTYSEVRAIRFTMSNAITVYPNPATNFVRVYSQQANLTADVFDANGKKMASRFISNGFTEFNVSRFPVGTYLIVIQSNGVRIETKKIIKQ
ncbi:MAG: T9SS type A sorting domain-containing protein, partial [Bacteroidota bacterium]|nr:T9SS type A sorting domain-containing protein [Bacteroidota bacterium]